MYGATIPEDAVQHTLQQSERVMAAIAGYWEAEYTKQGNSLSAAG